MPEPSDSTVSALRPKFLIDGEEVPGLGSALISMLVEETLAGLFRCELRLLNWGARASQAGYLFFERDIIDFGRVLVVAMSDNQQLSRELFRGRIMGLEAHYPADQTPHIVILAEDRLQDLRMTRRSRSFEQMTDDSIIEQVAQDHGLQVEAVLNTIPTVHEWVVQANQSDLAFMRERARRINATLRLDGDSLFLIELPGLPGDALQLRYGQELTQFRVLADLAQQRTEVHVSGWNAANKSAIDAAAGHEAIQGELQGGVSGSAILYDVFGEREDYVVHQAPSTQAEAQTSATSRYLEMARSFVRGTGSAVGDPRIRAGLPLELGGLGQLFDGLYYVTQVQHRFDAQRGYVTDFEVERPAIGRLYRDEETPNNIEKPGSGLGHTSGGKRGPAKEPKS